MRTPNPTTLPSQRKALGFTLARLWLAVLALGACVTLLWHLVPDVANPVPTEAEGEERALELLKEAAALKAAGRLDEAKALFQRVVREAAVREAEADGRLVAAVMEAARLGLATTDDGDEDSETEVRGRRSCYLWAARPRTAQGDASTD